MKHKIIAVVICSCLLMGWVDAVWVPSYFVKSAVKIALFSLLPLLCFGKNPKQLCTVFANPKQGLRLGLLCGGAVFTVILGGYFALCPYIDLSGITASLENGLGVTGSNFIWVALYISFVNSFLEEFFFRGFAFLQLCNHVSARFACIFSAFCFALYHVAMMIGWFSPLLFALALLGLFIGGLLFNYFASKSLFVSWLIHLCANLAINTVGFILFAQ